MLWEATLQTEFVIMSKIEHLKKYRNFKLLWLNSHKLFMLSKEHQANQRDLLSLFLEQEFDNLR